MITMPIEPSRLLIIIWMWIDREMKDIKITNPSIYLQA